MTVAQQPKGVREPFLHRTPARKHEPSNANHHEVAAEDPSDGPKGAVTEHRLSRFWMRTSVVILVPVAITIYYLWIWLYCLRDSNPIKYAAFDQAWIYYTWFITGVFGLDISRHGLLGVEAGMLQVPFWQARNAMVMVIHSGATWSGPGGWRDFLMKRLRRREDVPGRLWHVLAVLSAMVFAAFPISGLTMELADGYVPSKTPAMVVGQTWADFNLRDSYQTVKRGIAAWSNGLPTGFPGVGLVYTPPYLERGQYKSFDAVPNSLPTEDAIPGLFVAPQATTPVAGKIWGLLIQYNCSIVESASEFTILNQKFSARRKLDGAAFSRARLFGAQKVLELSVPSNSTINVFNASVYGGDGRNLWAYAEMGLSRNPGLGYGDPAQGIVGPESANRDDILEYALWQVRLDASYHEADEILRFNASTEPSVAGMGHPFVLQPDGKFEANRTFSTLGHESADGPSDINIMSYVNITNIHGRIRSLADPIGVRCRRTSSLGEAELDVKRSVFTSFKESPSPPFNASTMEMRTFRFGATAAHILAGRYTDLFTAVNSPPPLAYSNSVAYRSFVQPKTLLAAIMRAHAVDALQLMYDGVGTMDGAYLNPNLTTTRRGKILEPGPVPAELAAVLFLIWCTVSMALGLRYGFGRRWSASLDGYSLFRFGADLADRLAVGSRISSVRPFDECEKLLELPGLVGDSRTETDVGHVSLVESSNLADSRKLYA